MSETHKQTPATSSDIGAIVQLAVTHSGLTRRALAKKARLAPETLSRLTGRGTADFATVARLVRSAGLRLQIEAPGTSMPKNATSDHERLDARSWAMHSVIAGKIAAHPALVTQKVLPTIRRFKRIHAGTGTVRLLEEWERAAKAGAEALIQLCVAPTQKSQQLRQTSPLTGILTAAERKAVYDAFPA